MQRRIALCHRHMPRDDAVVAVAAADEEAAHGVHAAANAADAGLARHAGDLYAPADQGVMPIVFGQDLMKRTVAAAREQQVHLPRDTRQDFVHVDRSGDDLR